MSYREKLTSAGNWRYPTQRAPCEKEQFVAYLNERLPDKQLQGLVKSLFRPSYGGNRNWAFRQQHAAKNQFLAGVCWH